MQRAAALLIDDYTNNQVRFKRVHIPTEILEVAQRQIGLGSYPEQKDRAAWIQRRIDASEKIEAEERTLAEAAAIQARREQEETEKEKIRAQEEAEQASQRAAIHRDNQPHQMLIGIGAVPQRAADGAVAFMRFEWQPDGQDDQPSAFYLTRAEAQQWCEANSVSPLFLDELQHVPTPGHLGEGAAIVALRPATPQPTW